MTYFCYECVQPRHQCPPGHEPGSCAVTEGISAEYREELALSGKRVYLASMPGGTTKLAGQMDHTRKFDRDMHDYREAVRSGEQPDQVSTAAVERTRKRQEVKARVAARDDL